MPVSAPLRDFDHATGPAEADSLLPLFVPVPEGLGEVLGYRGEARFIGMFWSDDANEVIVTDGSARGVGESLRFLEYCGHGAVETEIGDLNIGLFDEPATVWLVLDRRSHNLYYAPATAAHDVLARQHGPATVGTGCLELRQRLEDVLDGNDPEVERLRAYLDAFHGTRNAE